MAVEILPALVEVLKLLFIFALLVAAIVGAVKLNFLTWSSQFYLPGLVALGLAISLYLKYFTKADVSILTFAFLFPLAVGLFFKYSLKGRYQSPMLFAAPAVTGVFLLFMYPLVFEVYLAFHRLSLTTLSKWIQTGEIDFAGFQNFVEVFSLGSSTKESFWLILGRTLAWTSINLFFHVTFGLILALLLNQKIKGIAIYRTILILPWAIPQLIAVLAWRGEFHSTYGYINNLITTLNQVFSFSVGDTLYQPLALMGIVPQAWWTESGPLFASVCIVNIWLGVPFMMIICLSGLQSISKSFYEAASIDGASKIQQFRHITIPLLKPIVIPSAILGMIWTFNNVNVIYLMTAQRGGSGGADILVSDLYKQAFVFNRYSFSAAYAVVIFLILLVLTAVWLKVSKITDDPTR